jgi:hypothetical protein
MNLEAIKVEDRDAIKVTLDEDNEYILTPEELTEVGFSNYKKELELDEKELKFEHYRLLRKIYTKMSREYQKKGTLVHLAKYSNNAWMQMNEEYFKEHGKYPTQKGKTYVKEDKSA